MKVDRRVTGISEMFDGLAVRNVCGIQNFLRDEYSDATTYGITFSVREDVELNATLIQCDVENLLTATLAVSVLVYPDGKFFIYPEGNEEIIIGVMVEKFPGLHMAIPAGFSY